MKLFFIRLAVILFLFVISERSLAVVSTNRGFSSYIAAGPNFVFPGALRIGYGDWEGGLISPGFLGVDKIFPIGGSTYSSFGVGFSANDFSSSGGPQVAIGFNWDLLWHIGLRGELVGRALFDGSSAGFGLLGISYGF